MIERAMEYVKLGWLVLPLHTKDGQYCSCLAGRNRACTSPAKHPRTLHGVSDASKCPCAVRKWWGMWPEANIGIACGRESGLVVVDVDPRNGGEESLVKLLQDHSFPTSSIAHTGGGGLHFYFRYPIDGIPKQTLAPGIDLVSNGGYVVAPPSKHIRGVNYCWVHGRDPWDFGAMPFLPDWCGMLTGAKQGFSLPDTNYVAAGARNITFIRIAGAMRRWGLNYCAIEAALQIHNRDVCDPPMSKREVKTISHNAAGYKPEDFDGEAEQDERGGIRVAHRPVVD